MAKIIVMPKLGLTITEGTLSAWKKQVGDAVAEGEALFDVETDKLTNTVESSAAGILLQVLVEAGETVPCLTPVGVIGSAGEDISALVGAAPGRQPPAESAAPAAPPVQTEPEKAAGGRVLASPRPGSSPESRGSTWPSSQVPAPAAGSWRRTCGAIKARKPPPAGRHPPWRPGWPQTWAWTWTRSRPGTGCWRRISSTICPPPAAEMRRGPERSSSP